MSISSTSVSFPGKSLGEFNNYNAFSAILKDGSVISWGSYYKNRTIQVITPTELTDGTKKAAQIFTSYQAFASINLDGSVTTWGNLESTSMAPVVQVNPNLVNVKQIYSTAYAFAALKNDGTVETWGDVIFGGYLPAGGSISDVSSIYSNAVAFVALKTDGSAVAWGDQGGYGSGSISDRQGNPHEQYITLPNKIVKIFSSGHAFAALCDDGSVHTWGSPYEGGNSSVWDSNNNTTTDVSEKLNGSIDVVNIYSTTQSFAAIRADGSVVTWGRGDYGGDSSSIATLLNGDIDVTKIFSSDGAFAALRADGSVVTWGSDRHGGNSESVVEQLNGGIDISDIASTHFGFAALRSDGTVISWGGDSLFDASALDGKFVTNIFATGRAFAALCSDGSVVSWGDFLGQSNWSQVASQLDGSIDVIQVFANDTAFAALRSDGSLVTWGPSSYGGDSSSVSTHLQLGVKTLANPFNSLPIGVVAITGTAAHGQTLTASNNLADADGLGTIAYQWQADGSNISGATEATLVLGQDQVGKTISVIASYTDSMGTSEIISSSTTSMVLGSTSLVANQKPTGLVTISGSVMQGQTLTAIHTLIDEDGLGNISYQWQADGNNIAGATASTYILTANEVGKAISVVASYVDDYGTAERVSSANTAKVGLHLIGTADNDVLHGSVGNDLISGLAGNDRLIGAEGNDTLLGGEGDDYLVGGRGLADDVIDGGANGQFGDIVSYRGMDAINNSNTGVIADLSNGTATGIAGNDTLIDIEHIEDSRYDDNLTGNADSNWFKLSTGNDTVDGQAGLDTVMYEDATSGVNVDLKQGLANGLSIGTDVLINIEAIHGSRYSDRLALSDVGGYVFGRVGDDQMLGGLGNDFFVGGSGNDSIDGGLGDGNTVSYEDDHFDGIEATSGVTVNLQTGVATDNWGNTDQIRHIQNVFGSQLDDALTGDAANNRLEGQAGNDTLNGLTGFDTLIGGLGNDTYIVDTANALVLEAVNEGIDTVLSSVTYTLTSNVENLQLTGTQAINATGNDFANLLTGNSAANLLNGGEGNDTLQGFGGVDTLMGGLGDDTYRVNLTAVGALEDRVIESAYEGIDTLEVQGVSTQTTAVKLGLADHFENLDISRTATSKLDVTGNNANNILTGNAANNVLNGGLGADTLIGGLGSDVYYVDQADDVVIENANEGVDEVMAAISYSLSANLEKLTLTGKANINATGNASANTLSGNNGDNILDGGAGNDTLQGMGGNDTYVVDSNNDVVIESANAGYDTVWVAINGQTGAYSLASNIEVGVLKNTQAFNLTGNQLNNSLTGNSAANLLDGGLGIDTLIGGLGDDTYLVDVTTAGALEDSVFESANAGTDTLKLRVASSNVTASTFTLAANLENLDASATGMSAFNLTGNAANNLLTGNSANNTLDGGVGADALLGRAGNDTYVIDNAGDLVYETTSVNSGIDAGGRDLVKVAIATANGSYSLGNFVENGLLINNVAFNLNGNGLNNALTGNALANNLNGGAGADTLDGGAGNDVLTGGEGNDVLIGGLGNDNLTGNAGSDLFVFNSAPNASTNKDTLIDFLSGTDKLQFSKAVFAGLGSQAGGLSAGQFWASANATGAHDADDRLVYNTTSGALYYDADGNGGSAAVQIALIGTTIHPTLTYTDIQIIG